MEKHLFPTHTNRWGGMCSECGADPRDNRSTLFDFYLIIEPAYGDAGYARYEERIICADCIQKMRNDAEVIIHTI